VGADIWLEDFEKKKQQQKTTKNIATDEYFACLKKGRHLD
jgi:hypothetical protein